MLGIRPGGGLTGDEPRFRSLCSKPVNVANYTLLPTNGFYFQNHALSLNSLSGMNGQLRIFESITTPSNFGFIIGY